MFKMVKWLLNQLIPITRHNVNCSFPSSSPFNNLSKMFPKSPPPSPFAPSFLTRQRNIKIGHRRQKAFRKLLSSGPDRSVIFCVAVQCWNTTCAALQYATLHNTYYTIRCTTLTSLYYSTIRWTLFLYGLN